ncbi:MAG TPA: hypothetical protein VF974_00445 [Patescibacteria group bacterium]
MQNQKIPETLTWKAPSHIKHQRSSAWYLIFSLCGLALLAFAFYIRSITAGLTFFLIVVVLLIISTQSSREVTYKVTKTGIAAGNMIYPFKIIKRFWIIYNPPEVKTLHFETTAYLNSQVTLQLGPQDPVELKLVLGGYLPEDIEMEESITESLARRLKI